MRGEAIPTNASPSLGFEASIDHVETATPIAHLIVVAGLSSSGKSTFLRDLADKRLQPEILRELPSNADDWPQIEASQFSKWLPNITSESGKTSGLVLHYDLNRIHKVGAYHNDPSLRVLKLAVQVTSITLRPNVNCLKANLKRLRLEAKDKGKEISPQFVWGAARVATAALVNFSRLLGDELINRIRRQPLIANVWSKLNRAANVKHWRRIAQYGDEKGLSTIYATWDAYIASTQSQDCNIRKLTIDYRDDAAAPGLRVWRLAFGAWLLAVLKNFCDFGLDFSMYVT